MCASMVHWAHWIGHIAPFLCQARTPMGQRDSAAPKLLLGFFRHYDQVRVRVS